VPRDSLVRALFFGTPEIAVGSLQALVQIAEIVGVVCQPDRPAGRGLQLRAPAVKTAALELGLQVHQPRKVRTPEFEDWVRSKEADVALVIAYGRILTVGVLAAPRLGCLNLHASLLPRYRGAAPIQRALMAGEDKTGVCLMQMDEGLDTGPVLSRHELRIAADDDAGSLFERLGALAAQVTLQDLPRFFRGELVPEPQDEAQATLAPPLGEADQKLSFALPAAALAHLVRGLAPRPGATATLTRKTSQRLKVLRARAVEPFLPLAPGEIGIDAGRVLVGTSRGLLEILEAQLEGKRALTARDLVNGRALSSGDRLE